MPHMIARSFTATAVAALLTLVYPAEASADDGVRLIGEQLLPTGLEHAGTTVGGLSGIDRDPKTGSFVLLSDDRSAINPARFYTAEIEVSEAGLGPIRLTGQHSLRRADGSTYPSAAEWAARPCTESRAVCDRLAPVDPEDIRIDPHGADVWWSQEGDRNPPRLLTDPSIRRGGAGPPRPPGAETKNPKTKKKKNTRARGAATDRRVFAVDDTIWHTQGLTAARAVLTDLRNTLNAYVND